MAPAGAKGFPALIRIVRHMTLIMMKATNIFIISLIIIFLSAAEASTPSTKGEVFMREDFNTLTNWRGLDFILIKRPSKYSIAIEATERYLKSESDASASGLIFTKKYNVYEYPKARWRWKVSGVYSKGDVTKKAGDDYPARIIFMFKYDPEGSSLGKRIRYEIAKGIYGFYPPQTTLIYVWANRKSETGIFTSTYAPEEKIVVLEQGADKAGKWLEEEVNVVEDYRKAFGSDPPSEAGIAIMNDSDDTGEKAVSFIDYIEIAR